MKRILFLILTCLAINEALGQVIRKSFDFIIVIDERIPISSMTNFRIRLDDGTRQEIVKSSYHPGNLSLEELDYSILLSDSSGKLFLEFTYFDHSDKRHNIYSYSIELKKVWLDSKFNVLYIYNLDKRKYKNRFEVEENSKYIYELDSPDYGFKRIRRR